jgi:hypothetical protein
LWLVDRWTDEDRRSPFVVGGLMYLPWRHAARISGVRSARKRLAQSSTSAKRVIPPAHWPDHGATLMGRAFCPALSLPERAAQTEVTKCCFPACLRFGFLCQTTLAIEHACLITQPLRPLYKALPPHLLCTFPSTSSPPTISATTTSIDYSINFINFIPKLHLNNRLPWLVPSRQPVSNYLIDAPHCRRCCTRCLAVFSARSQCCCCSLNVQPHLSPQPSHRDNNKKFIITNNNMQASLLVARPRVSSLLQRLLASLPHLPVVSRSPIVINLVSSQVTWITCLTSVD